MLLSQKNNNFAELDTLVQIAKEQGFNNLEDAQVYFNNNLDEDYDLSKDIITDFT